ncbi:hypothetical protein [Bacillus sp. FJAT-50079]|uniref:hypothetical protein n=1 Tax=Bacillus sp. FJAT-50079 TaxID=2833577 RepID=UPI001BCA184C|nr:hypothetical protein [Bacillus sp. FJAT-50079]MBS4209068.1 hypothetical protein [Bacillus sp. FJAT-50079]
MEQLILLAIFGIISMAFNAMKKSKQQQSDQRKPVAQQAKPFVEPRKELVEHDIDLSKARNLREAAEMLFTKPAPAVKEVKKAEREEVREQIIVSEKREATQNALPTSKPDAVKRSSLPLQQNDIVNGIIMAEVLGPPRAVKRYRPQRNV